MGSCRPTHGNRRADPAIRPRLCARPGCDEVASATMTYDYGNRSTWIDQLDPESSPAGYDLCVNHANSLGVPSGWTRTDRREPPSPFERVAV